MQQNGHRELLNEMFLISFLLFQSLATIACSLLTNGTIPHFRNSVNFQSETLASSGKRNIERKK